MNRRRQIVRHQQQRIQQHTKNSNAHAFFKLLADPELLQRVESVTPKHRQRLFPPTETLSMFLAQAMNADRSCQKAVNDFSIKRCCDGLSPGSVYTGAYCKARARLPVEMVSTLQRVKNLYALATSSPKSLGRVEMTRSAPHFVDLYCVRHTAKGRKHQRVTGSIARSKLSRQSAIREREPWLLASNLPQSEWNPAKIVAIYKRRMQIEEGFRDVKSEHLGWGLNLHRSQCPKRIEVLLLIAALANYLIFLTGLQARENQLERRYQSNSLKERRVLSLWRLGLEYWRSCTGFGDREHLEILEHALRDEVHHQAQSLE